MNVKLIIILFILCLKLNSSAQEQMNLTMNQVIEIAQQKSLNAYINENLFLSSSWKYRAFLAQKRPWVEFFSRPIEFDKSIDVITDNTGTYLSRTEKFTSDATLSVSQNILSTGGEISLYTDLNMLNNYSNENLFWSATPVSIQLSQPLFQFNSFKWDKKLAPLNFEIAKKEYSQSNEEIAMKAISYFFDLLDAQLQYKIAQLNKQSADSLYIKSKGRYERGAIALIDLQRLELNMLNTHTSFEKAKMQLERNKYELKSFLGLRYDQELMLEVPDSVPDLNINPQEALNMAMANNPEILEFQQTILQADRNVDRAKGNNGLRSSVDLNLGFDKSGQSIQSIYQNPDRAQDVSVSLYIPILDWGMSKGQREMAISDKKVAVARVEMEKNDFEQNILMSALEFNMLKSMILNAKKANAISEKTYQVVEDRFLLGKVNLETFYAARNERDNALSNYYNRIRNYWYYYYYMRSITLYDFQNEVALSKN